MYPAEISCQLHCWHVPILGEAVEAEEIPMFSEEIRNQMQTVWIFCLLLDHLFHFLGSIAFLQKYLGGSRLFSSLQFFVGWQWLTSNPKFQKFGMSSHVSSTCPLVAVCWLSHQLVDIIALLFSRIRGHVLSSGCVPPFVLDESYSHLKKYLVDRRWCTFQKNLSSFFPECVAKCSRFTLGVWGLRRALRCFYVCRRTVGGFKRRATSFACGRRGASWHVSWRVQRLGVTGAILVRWCHKTRCILCGRCNILDVSCCMFCANRIVSAASGADNMQMAWQAWDIVRVSFCLAAAAWNAILRCRRSLECTVLSVKCRVRSVQCEV